MTLLEDYDPPTHYFKFVPRNPIAEVSGTPLMGDVQLGKIYPVTNPMVAQVLGDHSDWQRSTKNAFDAQAKESS